MSIAAILAAITALGGIVTGLVYVFKYVANKVETTPEEKKESVDADVQKKEDEFSESGRPS